MYNGQDLVQNAMLGRLQQAHDALLLSPAIPLQPEFRDWPLRPGSDPPEGPARDAYVSLAQTLDDWRQARNTG
jgi:hypothetical protein